MISDGVVAGICHQAEANLEEQIALTQDLLRVPSVTGNEGEAQAWMAELYRRNGLATESRPVDYESVSKHPEYCGLKESADAYRDRPNVIGTQGGSGGGRSLLLNGHVDVVSPEPTEQWVHDPWGGEIADGRLYGRGANDMKANLIANLMALRCLRDLGVQLEGDVILQSVIEEEAGGGGGTLALLESGSVGDAIVISEPTNLGVRVGSGGVLYFRITVEGRTAHAGNAHLGTNAISRMIPIFQALERLDQERGARKASLFEHGSYGRSCHLNLGVLRAGDWPSTVPGSAVLEGRLGFLPHEEAGTVKEELTQLVLSVAAEDPWLREHPPLIEWYGFRAAPWLEPDDSPLVAVVRNAATSVLGEPVGLHARASAVDNRFAPLYGMPTLCFGSRGGGNHGIDEYVELDSLAPLTATLALTALEWCGGTR